MIIPFFFTQYTVHLFWIGIIIRVAYTGNEHLPWESKTNLLLWGYFITVDSECSYDTWIHRYIHNSNIKAQKICFVYTITVASYLNFIVHISNLQGAQQGYLIFLFQNPSDFKMYHFWYKMDLLNNLRLNFFLI